MTKTRFLALTLLITGSALAFLFTGIGTGQAPAAAVDTAPVQIATYWFACDDLCVHEQNLCLQGCTPSDLACRRSCARVYRNCSISCDTSQCSPAHPAYPFCYQDP